MSRTIHEMDVNTAIFFEVLGINMNISKVFHAELNNDPSEHVEITIPGTINTIVYGSDFGAGAVKKRKEVTEK